MNGIGGSRGRVAWPIIGFGLVVLIRFVLANGSGDLNAEMGDCVAHTTGNAVRVVECDTTEADYRLLSRGTPASVFGGCPEGADSVLEIIDGDSNLPRAWWCVESLSGQATDSAPGAGHSAEAPSEGEA